MAPAPYAGTNRVRFNGFAGFGRSRYPASQVLSGPPQGSGKCSLPRRGVQNCRIGRRSRNWSIACEFFRWMRSRTSGSAAIRRRWFSTPMDRARSRCPPSRASTPHAEVAFVSAADAADHDVRLRFFNARKEAPFVGHATIAAHAVLLALGRRGAAPVRQACGTGVVEVRIRELPDTPGRAPIIEFRQTVPELDNPLPFKTTLRVAEALKLPATSLHEIMPARIARKGVPACSCPSPMRAHWISWRPTPTP